MNENVKKALAIDGQIRSLIAWLIPVSILAISLLLISSFVFIAGLSLEGLDLRVVSGKGSLQSLLSFSKPLFICTFVALLVMLGLLGNIQVKTSIRQTLILADD